MIAMIEGIQAWVVCGFIYAAGILLQNLSRLWLQMLMVLGCSRRLSRKPSESAILITGARGHDELILRLSNMGYTVFAVFKPDCDSEDSMEVSEILRLWHHRQVMLPRVSWGLVAPITANLTNPEDRGRVCGTIKSYCVQHSLNLVSVIYLHQNPLVKGPKSLFSTSLRSGNYTGDQRDTDGLHKSILADIMDPYLSLTDFFPQLSTSSGNIIMVSEEDMYDVSLRYRQAVARNMHDELSSLGIDVTSVISGPRARVQGKTHSTSSFLRHLWANAGSPHVAIQWLLHSFCVSQEDYHSCVESIICEKSSIRTRLIGSYPHTKALISRWPRLLRYLSLFQEG
ncbi:hypothetical protein AB1N83_003048 [Pleurotus pulmonarius]